MSSNPKTLLIAAIPLFCLLASIPVYSAFGSAAGQKTETEKTEAARRPYDAKLRLYQELARLTSRANQNGGKVTITKDELKALSRDFRNACEPSP